MDPITGGLAIIGLGMKIGGAAGGIFSGFSAAGYEKQEAEVSEQNTMLEMQQNQVRMQLAQLASRRQAAETVRNTQMAQAQALAAATNQGAAGGGGAGVSSGLAGGQAQIAAAGATTQEAISQNWMGSQQIFSLGNQIDANKIRMAQLGASAANAQGIGAIFQGVGQIGGALASSAGPLGNILGNFFGNSADATAASQGFGYGATSNYQNSQGFAIGGV